MSRKNNSVAVVLFVLVSLMSLLLTACDGGDNTCVSGVYDTQGMCMVRENPTVQQVKKEVEKTKDDVQKAMQDAKDAADKAVQDSLNDVKTAPGNPFNAAGDALDEQSCKARGGVWFAHACSK